MSRSSPDTFIRLEVFGVSSSLPRSAVVPHPRSIPTLHSPLIILVLIAIILVVICTMGPNHHDSQNSHYLLINTNIKAVCANFFLLLFSFDHTTDKVT